MNRNDFYDLVREEMTRAMVNIGQYGGPTYELARQEDGSVEAFADGVRVEGAAFWTLSEENTRDFSVDDYLTLYWHDMSVQYLEAGDEL